MNLVIRLALTWLLALALPLQGYAAVSMLLCGPNHHGQQVLLTDGHDHADGNDTAHHDLVGDAADGAVTGASAATPVDGMPGDGSIDGAKAGKPLTGKCSVCASCCSAAAIVSILMLPDIVAAAPVYSLARLEPHAGFTPGGLERPPRLILA